MSLGELAPVVEKATGTRPTIWGLTPAQIYDRFWAARGVQVVRQGERFEIVKGAELFLLTDPGSLVLFKLYELVETLSWIRPSVMWIRLRAQRELGYRETVVSDEEHRFVRFERNYDQAHSRLTRVALTPWADIARAWQGATDLGQAWQELRVRGRRPERACASIDGLVYFADDEEETLECLRALVSLWRRPDMTIPRVRKAGAGVWADPSATLGGTERLFGKVWVGAGRELGAEETVAGPAILWDDPEARPESEEVRWQEIEPSPVIDGKANPVRESVPFKRLLGKRIFDILFALAAILVTLPLYPFIALAIIIEDGWPVFFAHRREGRGGREFPCVKFRSMKKDAERIKEELNVENQSDGPQFFMDQDPRTTRVGRFLRASQLDELPQFWNVLVGQMSVVGPRPSPRAENQYCPPWREGRLSMRPGITGLWQVMRTREEGLDFQEWIRFDLEYVERASWALDLRILWKTVLLLVGWR